MTNSTMLVPDPVVWQNTGMIVPAVMTLICFICTAVSLTVSGFICLRDREAQDESDLKAKHQREQEFISKVLGLFYKTRTSNVFRIKEIVSDLNEERPVWVGEKKEVISIMEYYGIFLTEADKQKLPHNAEVFEIDCESLFYFELERFSKAQAIYGSNILKYFQAIQQDGSSFPREFYPDIKPVFHIDIIYNVFTEMQIITELFVLLATGIDLEIISLNSIPPQFRHSQLGNEFAKIQDFLFNYYLRVFPKERSTASVMRIIPKLPVVYEPIIEEKTEMVEHLVEEEEEVIDDEVYETPTKPPRRPSTISTTTEQYESADEFISKSSSPSISPHTATAANRGGRFTKQRLKMVKVYKTLAERIKQRPYYQEDDTGSIAEEDDIPYMAPSSSDQQASSSKQVRFERSSPALPARPEPIKKTVKKMVKKQVPITVQREVRLSQEEVLEAMRHRYKAPSKRDGQARRRGRLFKQQVIEHNAFTYMVARVLAFLQDKGQISDTELNTQNFLCVERNFIV